MGMPFGCNDYVEKLAQDQLLLQTPPSPKPLLSAPPSAKAQLRTPQSCIGFVGYNHENPEDSVINNPLAYRNSLST